MTDNDNPWSVAVTVMQIPETGLHREIEAKASERDAIAALGGLQKVLVATAALDLTPVGEGRVRVQGWVKARVCQTCVVTLDPVENEVDEAIDLIFAPASQIRELAESIDDGPEVEAADPPEPIEKGIIDIGRLATDALFLGLDPYPRKPDAVFEPIVEPIAPEEHPFAALKALKTPEKPSRSRKTKRD
ncbi:MULTISPECIES: DUF177 domain-containing protein [Rhodopseudomonas]|uniref:Phosphodiesterase n=1 Tax=Rhodopseudomonas palustris TaxID=1076 RepID=A0A0D7F5A5_RHOPL|nr:MULTISPECIES: DUF177 domain-containing protein [Rhodopseudomonas]KIZ47961.1 phosphodiesterase [Rhodopseudomonas palustris]MDF3808791.1 DUF177 domain-containing protein [Rhodopseudomonas sp. BAL398]WOK19173.1 DUF177 domain-containing protein [Rhodopseudomonas sp. BAL398]